MSKTNTALSATARTAIVSSYVNALDSHENSGSLLTQVCETANKYTRGESLSEEDQKAIAAGVSSEKGWKGKTAASRESEVRVILRASAELPEAIEVFTTKNKRCDWHTGMKLARRLNKGDNIAKAVKHVMQAIANGGQGAKANPAGRTAAALKAWFAAARGEKKQAIRKAFELLGLSGKLA
jgi:hypothetical protein